MFWLGWFGGHIAGHIQVHLPAQRAAGRVPPTVRRGAGLQADLVSGVNAGHRRNRLRRG